jgi:hypothetical protein
MSFAILLINIFKLNIIAKKFSIYVASTPHRRLAALILHHQRLANISPTKRLSECFVEKHNEL